MKELIEKRLEEYRETNQKLQTERAALVQRLQQVDALLARYDGGIQALAKLLVVEDETITTAD